MDQNYKNLVDKVDSKFEQIVEKYGDQMVCQKGCFQCCKADLSVSEVEWRAIKEFASDNLTTLKKAKRKNDKNQCEFLDEDGGCLIYPVRPIICRSHGAPILYKSEETDGDLSKDVCPLNFSRKPLEEVDDQCFINVELVNTILAMTNQMATGEKQRKKLLFAALMDEITGEHLN